MKKKRTLTVQIKGADWKVVAMPSAMFKRANGDCGAVTYPEDQEMHFNLNSFNPGLVRHELIHAYVSASNVESASPTADQIEELAASIYQYHGPEMSQLVDRIVTFMLKEEK